MMIAIAGFLGLGPGTRSLCCLKPERAQPKQPAQSRTMSRGQLHLNDSDDESERIRFASTYNHHQRDDFKYHSRVSPVHGPSHGMSPLLRRRMHRFVWSAVVTIAVGLMLFNGMDSIFGGPRPPAVFGGRGDGLLASDGLKSVLAETNSAANAVRGSRRGGDIEGDSEDEAEGSRSDGALSSDEELAAGEESQGSVVPARAGKKTLIHSSDATEDVVPSERSAAALESIPGQANNDPATADPDYAAAARAAAKLAEADVPEEPSGPTEAQKALKVVHEHSKSLKGNVLASKDEEPVVIGELKSAAERVLDAQNATTGAKSEQEAHSTLAAPSSALDDAEDEASKPSKIVSKADKEGKLLASTEKDATPTGEKLAADDSEGLVDPIEAKDVSTASGVSDSIQQSQAIAAGGHAEDQKVISKEPISEVPPVASEGSVPPSLPAEISSSESQMDQKPTKKRSSRLRTPSNPPTTDAEPEPEVSIAVPKSAEASDTAADLGGSKVLERSLPDKESVDIAGQAVKPAEKSS